MTAAPSASSLLEEASFRIAVLGDSRVFDTYYATGAYAGAMYGYHKTFPHLLLRTLAGRFHDGRFDCVHIPDHFRGRTVENNILRLALIDPECVVLCDAIWESLLSKKHFDEYVEKAAVSGEHAAPPPYSEQALVDLFERDLLSLSPSLYAERVKRIASWFTRRQRRVVWLTTPIPPPDHLGGLHYAGNYRPITGWHRCLAHLNERCSAAVSHCGGEILDLHQLMASNGGATTCLIDQWHFSDSFHAIIAEALFELIVARPFEGRSGDCVSRRTMIQGASGSFRASLIGARNERDQFKRAFPQVQVASEDETFLPDVVHEAVVLLHSAGTRERIVADLIRSPRRPIIVFPEDLLPIDNPAAADRSAFGSFK